MMHKLKYIFFWACCIAGTGLSAQQIQQFTQYQWAGLSYNPAFAGTDQYFNALGMHRTQWTGIEDAPRTYLMSLDAPSKSGKMGFGGTLLTDVAGPTRRFSLQGSYAYHIRVSESSEVSLGASFGLTQFTIDGSQITLRQDGDNALTRSMESETKPDASFGVLWYSDKFKIGFSATQILNNKLDLFPGDGEGNMAVHYYLTGSYCANLSETFSIEPSVLMKYVKPVDPQFDISARLIYKSNIWLGGSYRTSDAVAIFAGCTVMNYLSLGYSYDFTTSAIRSYTDGTHELFIRLRFGKPQMVDEAQQNE